jgi:hypothetical protein
MLYRVSAKVLNGHERMQRFALVEAESGDEAAVKAHLEFKKNAGAYAVIVEDVRPASSQAEAAAPKPRKKAG